MIKLYLRDNFKQSLLQNYLIKQGYEVTIIENPDLLHPPSTTLTLITEQNQTRWTNWSKIQLVWLVNCDSGFSLKSALPNTVCGVLSSRSSIDELLPCLQIIGQGQKYISSQLWQGGHNQETDVAPVDPLTCLSRAFS